MKEVNHDIIIFISILLVSLVIAASVDAVYTQPKTKLYLGEVNISNVSVVYYGENDYGISLNMSEATRESNYTYIYDKDLVFPVTIAYENLIAIEWYNLQNQSERIKRLEDKMEIVCAKVKCDES